MHVFEQKIKYANDYSINHIEFIYDIRLVWTFKKS